MAAANHLLSEDQFLCSICLDVFTDPVSTSCGHNFCKNCITEHWDTNDRWQCPMCNEVFNTRPKLRVNTFISEMAAQFRQSAQQEACSSNSSSSKSSSSDQQVSNPGEVPCDVCTGTKLKALKSCLVCLVSYCETHLEPHLTASGLKKHQLIDPVENLEARMCTKHDKPLELFCKTDQTCVCMLCTVSDHKMHDVVPMKEGYEGKKAELGKTEAEIQQMIQKRRLKIQEIKQSESVERGLKELIDTIEEKQRTAEQQAEGFIKELEQEISELIKRRTEMEQLSRSEDHLHLLQSVQQYAINVTLDPDTAHPTLILSDDGKQLNPGDIQKNLPNNPERFSLNPCVLGKQSFSSGRFYFEVQVNGKTEWDLGVARESINRKQDIPLSPDEGYWTIWLRRRIKYKALTDPPVRLSLKSRPQKVGVFVDYEEGLVSFYDVDAAVLIYSFTGCCFSEKLFPYFNP
ncbi:E3 ubiquitin-protein ligase TRIM21-like, partial [Micropterus dolomieu]|uniref:E3 ubiquitin-protein ligase TRIM21-like n=1 Tax=Micropterus dolomieu TaxID=147949 RepID=UPI001E8CB07B